MAKKQHEGASSTGSVLGNRYRDGNGASAPGSVTVPPYDNHDTLGTPWAPMPNPNGGTALPGLTEQGDELCGSDSPRARGLGFSRYV
jgi:hypothetical protein